MDGKHAPLQQRHSKRKSFRDTRSIRETIVWLCLSVLPFLTAEGEKKNPEQHGHTVQNEPIKSCIRFHIPVVISI